jgi:hypothetical protein
LASDVMLGRAILVPGAPPASRARVGANDGQKLRLASEASRRGHYSGPTAVRERSHLDVPSPQAGRLILKSEHRRKSVQARFRRPIHAGQAAQSTGEPHPSDRRRRPTAASRGRGRIAPGKDLNCAFHAWDSRDSFGWAVTNLSPTSAVIDLGWLRIAVGGLP